MFRLIAILINIGTYCSFHSHVVASHAGGVEVHWRRDSNCRWDKKIRRVFLWRIKELYATYCRSTDDKFEAEIYSTIHAKQKSFAAKSKQWIHVSSDLFVSWQTTVHPLVTQHYLTGKSTSQAVILWIRSVTRWRIQKCRLVLHIKLP